MNKVLIVYYSRTGTTEKIVNTITDKTGWEVERIVDTKKWRGLFGFILAGMYAFKEKYTLIKPPQINPKGYDHVIIATPIWASNITPAIRTYISKYNESLKSCSFLLVSAGGGVDKAFVKLKELLGEPKSNVSLLKKEEGTSKENELLDQFIEEIKA